MAKPISKDERDANVFALYEQLVEIEQRLIPTGLHVFGRPSSAGEKTDLLKMIASFDRPEAGVRARHPDYDDAQVVRALTRLLHGDEPARLAWPSQRLLEP